MQLYGNKVWNDVTDNQHKAYFVMQEDAFRAVTERLDAEGLNYYAFEQNGIYKMAVNDHDLRYFRDVIGDRLLLQMDRTTTTRSNTPQTIIGPTEYRSIQNKRYFTSDIDMVLKIAEHLQQQNVPFSGRVYDDHATITVSAEHEAAVLDINNRVLTERQQHRHTVSQHLIVGSVPYQDIQQPFHFASRMKPQEFMQVRPILDAAGIPYSGIVKNGGIILTVNKQDVQQFGILLNAAQTKRHSIDELQEAGFSDHQIALMDTALDRFAEANDYDSIIDFVDPRFSDEQILYMADAAARYIVQSEADRIFDRSGILLDMIHYRDAAIHQLEFDEAFQDTAFSPEQLSVLRGMYDNGMTVSTLRSSLDESYTVEELQRIGTCFRDSDIDGLRKIQEQHNSELALVAFDPEPDDLAQTVYMHETEEEMQRDIPAGAWQEIAASEEIAEEPAVAGDTFQIYRLRDDANDLRIRFEGYDTLQQLGFVISADKYESIYTGALKGENATLNGIYETFNINHPADFNGYSLSVGDIIVLNQNGERSAHMVDSIGFMELPDFFLERQEPEQEAGERQPDLFDLPYSDRDKQVFGNTPFKYISGKTYHKMDTETAKQIAQELAAQEIKFSGRIKGDSTTLTVPAASEEQYQAIAAQFIPEEPAIEEPVQQPLELHIGDHIRLADDAQNAWIVTEVSDFILKLENADQKALASSQMMTGWQKHLDSSNVTILPEKGLPAPPPPKKRSAHIRKQAEGQLALFGEPEEAKSDRRHELLLNEVGRGSGFVNGKLRIYDYIHDNEHSNSELADFLKKEYGIGGHAGPDMPDVSHDSKGLFITDVDKREYQYSWSEVARTITELDKKEKYLTSQDIEDALDHARYYLNEVEHLDDRERAYYEGILAKWEHHPLLADLPEQPETTEPAVEEPAVQEEAQATAESVEIARSADGLLRFTLCEQREPAETPWNVQRWTRNSTDEDFRYNGFGRFTETEQEARDFITRQYERYEDNNCVDAITEAINRNYIDNHFDSEKALKEVQEHYPIERIALLLAAEVQNADWDGRYSGSVRDWSRKEMKQHGAAETEIALQRRQFPHPCLTNMLAEAVMEYQAAQAIEEPEIAEEPEQTVQAPTAEQPVKIRNTMEHRIFLRMRNLYPEVMQDSPTAHNYEHYESPNPGTGYEPFAIQRLTDWNNGQCLVSMMHTYEQNGDLMRDPDIVLRVDLTQQTATAISYQQDGLGIYREYPDGSYGQRDTNRFMLTWLKNLNDQHRELTQAEVEYKHDGTIYSIDLNYENGQLREVVCDGHPEVERAFAKEIGQKLDEIDAAAEAARTETPAERAKRLINAYTQGEFGQDADYSDMSHVDLAYVSDKETGMPIKVYADLEEYRIMRTLGGAVISEQQYDSLDDMCENALEYLDFNSMTDIDDSEREKAQQPNRTEKQTDFTIGEDFSVPSGKKGKYQVNIAAIRALKAIEAEDRAATPDEQKILAGYVGWGGVQEAFDSDKEDWTKEYTELRSILTDDEYAAARASTENAHYTQPMIISEMYQALERFGFTGGRVLEPSMGIGNFFGTMPETMRSGSELYGVELDSISGRIAKQLYPSADIEVTGFERTHFNDDAFDVVVGNVPFGNHRVMDSAYDEQKFKIHDYFLAKGMDKLKAGGIMAVVTSSGSMDKQDDSARKYLAERAELVGAVRLPNNAFKANAGADVTTDILFFQKRQEPLAADTPYPEWTQLSVTENGLRINSYFKEHPEMVLGTLEKSTNPYSSGVECVPLADADLRQQLSEALGRLSAEINREPVDMDVRDEQFTDDAPLKTYFMRDGNLYFKDSADKPAEVSDLTGKKRDRVIGMIGIRDAARAVIQAQTENCTDEKLNELQVVLTERYDAFYKKNGLIHSKANATVFREDDGFALICSLEKDFDLKQGTLGAKADIFTKRTINQFSEVDHAESSEDALIVSMQYRGKIDFPYMEQLCGKSKQEMIADLGDKIFPVPDLVHPERVTYQTADEYLSGNILVKLEQAKAAVQQNPLFAKNIPALEAVMPPKLRAGDIKVRLGATWIKPEYIRQFMYETLDTPKYYQVSKHGGFMQDRKSKIDVEFVPEAGLWHISNAKNDKSIKSTRDFGTKAMTAYEILDDVLNLRSPKIYMSVPDPGSERGEKRVLDGEATSLAQKKAALLQQAFENWIFKDPKRAADLVESYNALFNSTRPREYDGSHMIFPGMASDITLRPHQKNAIAHALYGGNALFAHCVGAGKTYEMIATAMEGKRLGMHHKSLFVVPKHLTAQIGEDFLRLYPSANILVATTKDFKAENRRELMARIATGNYDAVIISHDQFKRLPLSADRATRQIQIEVDTLTESINKARAESGGKSFTVKALERTRQALITQMEQIVAAAKRDEQNVTFEQLGIDHIFVDEAHEFKNLFCPTKLQNLSGISTSSSQKAMDLYIKCRYLDEETGSRGVTLATGTPISNSITEIHTMLRYLAHDTLEQHGLAAFDAFISTFGAPKTDWELSPTGNTWRQKTRMAGFDNMPELQSLWRAAADVQTAETLNLPTPDCEMHIVEAKPTQLQQEMMQELSDRADAIQAGSVDIHEDNNLLITSDGRKVGLDPRLVDPTLEDNPNTKLNQCVDNVFRIWNETSEQRSTQLIFCDLGVPHKTAKAPNKQENEVDSDDVSVAEMFSLEEELPFCVYDDIKEKLVSRGVPAEEIAFIHEAKTETQKSALFEKVRNGDVRVLIGSTPKMGTGTNVQDKLIALHDLDIPWRPADLEQRRGRMVRQGNENDKVHLYRYVTTGTFDAVSYQTLEAKQKFIGQVMTSQPVGRSCEDIDQSALSYAQIKAACTGDGRFKEKMQLETEVQALQIQRTEHLNTQDEMREKVAKLPHKIFMAEGNLSLIQLDYNQVAALPRDENGLQFSIDINGETITDKTEAAKRVSAYFSAAGKNPGQDIMVGNFCGFPLSITCQMNHIFATLHGQTTHTAELSMSTNYIVRGLQDLVNGIGRKLQKQTRVIAEMKVDLQQAKDRADQPFPQETELAQKSERLASLGDALRKEAMAKMLGGEKQGRQTFYFDRNRRNELRNAAKQAGQKPQEKQHSQDAPAVE